MSEAELWNHGFAWQSRALSAATVSAWVLVLAPVSLALGATSELVSLLLSIASVLLVLLVLHGE